MNPLYSRNPVLPVDFHFIDKLLDPATHFIQKTFGPDCFHCVKAITYATVLSYFYCGANCLKCLLNGNWHCLDLYYFIGSFVNPAIVLHLTDHPIYGIDALREKTLKDVAESGTKNSLLTTYDRVDILIVPLLVWWTIRHYGWGLDYEDSSCSGLYGPFILNYVCACFASCTPLPPSRSSVGKLLDAAKQIRDNVLNPEPGGLPA